MSSIFLKGSRWTSPGRLYPAETTMHGNEWMLSDVGQMSLHNIIKLWYFVSEGHRVEVPEGDFDEARSWCFTHVRGKWVAGDTPPSSNYIARQLTVRYEQGSWEPPSFESLWQRVKNDLFNQSVNLGVSARGAGSRLTRLPKPVNYFYFLDPQDAMLFKLTWGGE